MGAIQTFVHSHSDDRMATTYMSKMLLKLEEMTVQWSLSDRLKLAFQCLRRQ